jgi:hypothetical protein
VLFGTVAQFTPRTAGPGSGIEKLELNPKWGCAR